MSDNTERSSGAEFDREEFIARMIPILQARNMELGGRQLVDLMEFPEISDLAWAKLCRQRERLDNDLLCQVVKRHPRFRLEAGGTVLMNDPTTEQICCVHTFVPELAATARSMLEKRGYPLK